MTTYVLVYLAVGATVAVALFSLDFVREHVDLKAAEDGGGKGVASAVVVGVVLLWPTFAFALLVGLVRFLAATLRGLR